jgi:DNA-binding transcriptional regulator YhcF (GntR family)
MNRLLAIRIDVRSSVPAYRQIADTLRARLVEGGLPPGHGLPPVRRLAMELGVHFNTVAQAYRELAEEGWLDLKHGRGATVIERRAAPK